MKEEQQEEEQADKELHSVLELNAAQTWDDSAIYRPARKKVRVLGAQQGRTVVEGTRVGEMLALEQAMITFTTAEMAVTNNGDGEDGPRTPDTDIVPPVQAPNHEE